MGKANVAVFVIVPDHHKATAQRLSGKVICELPGCEYGVVKTLFYDLSRGRSAPQASVDKNNSVIDSKLESCLDGMMFEGHKMSKKWKEDVAKLGYIVERLV